MKYDVCPICGSPAQIHGNGSDHGNYSDYDIECFRCGEYNLPMWKNVFNIENFNKFQIIQKFTNQQIANISGWIREHQGEEIILDETKIESLKTLRNFNVFEKADNILLYLIEKSPIPGTTFPLPNLSNNSSFIDININRNQIEISEKSLAACKQILPLVCIGRIINYHEFNFVWSGFLRNEKRYLHESNNSISPNGWAHIETLKQANPDSKKAFVAMWFDKEMKIIYDNYISPAIEKAGFIPIRIDNKEHNNDINDEIIGEIRSSRFIVADFTGNRGGVYYEAGFANGLNIPVIHMCKKEELKEVHFDVNHRNIIDWKTGEELYERLLNRIKATIV